MQDAGSRSRLAAAALLLLAALLVLLVTLVLGLQGRREPPGSQVTEPAPDRTGPDRVTPPLFVCF